jgi:hypothetical protein
VQYFTFTRRYSMFAPPFTYGVDTVTHNGRIGEVARNEDNPRKWWASNRTWSDGADLARTFPTRHAAASALDWIAGGGDPAEVGGYDHMTRTTLSHDLDGYRALCDTCGWVGEVHTGKDDTRLAKADETEHRNTAAPVTVTPQS